MIDLSNINEQFNALANAETDNFVELALMIGLDPKKDFRFGDLSDVDLSNCDVRGFDFTGADLRRVKGTKVIWDSTTILTGADIENSIFEGRS